MKLRKVVKYYYPNGEEFDDSVFVFYLTSFLVVLIRWIFYPLFYIFEDNDYKGRREVYYEEIKKTKRRR